MDAPFHDVNCGTLVSEKPEGCDAFGLFHFNFSHIRSGLFANEFAITGANKFANT
jgi:hypothetical protein